MKHKYQKNLFSSDYLNKHYQNVGNKIIEISFYTLKSMIENKIDFNLLIGGVWCRNCQAIFGTLLEYLDETNKTIYMLDPRIGYQKKKINDFRKCLSFSDEEKLVYLTKNIKVEKQIRVNETYEIKIPFITKFKSGLASSYFEEEYTLEDITDDLKVSIKDKLNHIL